MMVRLPKSGKENVLTLRALLVGIAGSAVIASSSVYIALRLSALPWTIVFASIISFTLIRQLGKGSLGEVNVTHTAMSAGSMAAAATAFVLPALWRIKPAASLNMTAAAAALLVGTVLALAAASLLRRLFIEKIALPYPVGRLSYDAIAASEAGRSRAALLLGASGAAFVFAFLRDKFKLIPALLFSKAGLGAVAFSPMTVAMGYIFGPKMSLTWAFSTWLTVLVFIPLGMRAGFVPDFDAAKRIQADIGLGLMIGGSIGTLAVMLFRHRRFLPSVFGFFRQPAALRKILLMTAAAVFCALFLYSAGRVPLLPALLIVPAAFAATILAALLVGQVGINPLEVLGVIAFLPIAFISKIGVEAAVIMVAAASAACGLAGDTMNDFKVGRLFKTPPGAMLVGEAAGALAGIVAALFTLFVLQAAFGDPARPAALLENPLFTAAQSNVVAALIGGSVGRQQLFIGVFLGVLLALTPVPAVPAALGVYLAGYGLGTLVGIGGFLALVFSKRRAKEAGQLVSAGILAGEGFAGFMLAVLMLLLG
jgi:uncharacterized oligopeptide transporter (OPT) family protein